jgi:O-antigen/teichoic acid export membrane protein
VDPLSITSASNLVSGRLVARNVLWNLLGQGAPLLVAIALIPILVRSLGTERFGILTLAWVFIGYFSLFDLGLGRALTQAVARRLGAADVDGRDELPAVVWTALSLMLGLAIVGLVVVLIVSPALVQSVLRVPANLQRETLTAFALLSISIPVVVVSAGLRGVLEALQRFDLTNSVRVGLGVATYLGPVLVLPFSRSIVAAVAILLAVRVAAGLLYLVLCLRVMPRLRERISIRMSAAVPLLAVGGWMTVSNVVGPIILYIDRFLIGSVVSLTAVAFYAAPYDAVTKLLVIAGAVTGVLFPAFSTSFVGQPARTRVLFERGTTYLMLLLFPVSLVMVAFAHEALGLWLGHDFALHSTAVLQWLAIGVFCNSLAQVAFAMVQAAGRSDITAKLHLVELPIYVVLLLVLLRAMNIEGAALAWALRSILDMFVLFVVADRFLDTGVRQRFRLRTVALLAAPVVLAIPMATSQVAVRAALVLLLLAGFFVVGWNRGLSQGEREYVRRLIGARPLEAR